MKPYMIVEGTHTAIDSFEKKVADALERGYSLAGELIVQAQGSELKLYQPVILEEEEQDEDWDDEIEEEED